MREKGLMLAAVWLAACFVPGAWAEEHQVLGIDKRNYELMFFEPDFLRVEPGDTVTFLVTHFDHKPQSVLIPEGAEHWQAENGGSVTVTLREEGVYLFDCFYHNVMGMAGVIVVGAPVNLDEARRFFDSYKVETFAMNRERLNHIWDPDHGLLADAGRSGR